MKAHKRTSDLTENVPEGDSVPGLRFVDELTLNDEEIVDLTGKEVPRPGEVPDPMSLIPPSALILSPDDLTLSDEEIVDLIGKEVTPECHAEAPAFGFVDDLTLSDEEIVDLIGKEVAPGCHAEAPAFGFVDDLTLSDEEIADLTGKVVPGCHAEAPASGLVDDLTLNDEEIIDLTGKAVPHPEPKPVPMPVPVPGVGQERQGQGHGQAVLSEEMGEIIEMTDPVTLAKETGSFPESDATELNAAEAEETMDECPPVEKIVELTEIAIDGIENEETLNIEAMGRLHGELDDIVERAALVGGLSADDMPIRTHPLETPDPGELGELGELGEIDELLQLTDLLFDVPEENSEDDPPLLEDVDHDILLFLDEALREDRDPEDSDRADPPSDADVPAQERVIHLTARDRITEAVPRSSPPSRPIQRRQGDAWLGRGDPQPGVPAAPSDLLSSTCSVRNADRPAPESRGDEASPSSAVEGNAWHQDVDPFVDIPQQNQDLLDLLDVSIEQEVENLFEEPKDLFPCHSGTDLSAQGEASEPVHKPEPVPIPDPDPGVGQGQGKRPYEPEEIKAFLEQLVKRIVTEKIDNMVIDEQRVIRVIEKAVTQERNKLIRALTGDFEG